MDEAFSSYWNTVQTKLNAEISSNDKQLFIGLFFLVTFMCGCYLLKLAHPETYPPVKEFFLVLLLSGFWWLARQELMIHNPGSYLQRVAQYVVVRQESNKTVRFDEFQKAVGDWETYKGKLWSRNILLPISDVLCASFVFYIIFRIFHPYEQASAAETWWIAATCIALTVLSFPGVYAAIKLADR